VREAKLASLLQHGNIVQLHELGRVGASYFISMEYIAGRDLRIAIRQARRVVGPPPLAISLAILAELLDALDYAHNRCDESGQPLGLVHRDISPSNLIIGGERPPQGHRLRSRARQPGRPADPDRRHQGKAVLPVARDPDRPAARRPRRPVLASVIAYELLTTAPLFTGDSEFQTMDRLQRMVPPPPSAKNREVPPELDAIVLKGLAKEPERRVELGRRDAHRARRAGGPPPLARHQPRGGRLDRLGRSRRVRCGARCRWRRRSRHRRDQAGDGELADRARRGGVRGRLGLAADRRRAGAARRGART
jgi:hypothetical protein